MERINLIVMINAGKRKLGEHDFLCRPYGACLWMLNANPALKYWAKLCRPAGAFLVCPVWAVIIG